VKGLAIKEVAERTGLAAGTIRMWEQRYGVPVPSRTASGYRVYSDEDVELLRRAVAFRERGLSVSAALERAGTFGTPTDRPSIFGAIASSGAPVRPRSLHKRTLTAISHAIEDEAIARAAGPVVFGAFQRERNYRAVQHRYERIALTADATVVFADFPAPRVEEGMPAEVPIAPDAALGSEWAVVIDAPGYAACLLAWELPQRADARVPDRERRFESLWTMDPLVVRQAALVSCALAGRACPALAERVDGLLADRPLAIEAPTPALTALTNRMVAYMDA
jgi:DICT domain-containing protein